MSGVTMQVKPDGPCDHTLGAWFDFDDGGFIEVSFVRDLRKRDMDKVEWFNFCPRCGVNVRPAPVWKDGKIIWCDSSKVTEDTVPVVKSV